MLRLDVFEPDDVTGDERLVAALCYHGGELKRCEGDTGVVAGLLGDAINVPGEDGNVLEVRPTEDPELWMRWAPTRDSNAYRRVGPAYEDDDSLYDMRTGEFVGDETEKPLD